MAGEKEKGWGASIRDSLSSVRLTIPLLILIAAASIFGTVVPQNASPEDYLRIYKVSTYRILAVLGITDMYHAWWFFFLLGLLSLNLAACSWRRFPAVRGVFAEPQVRLGEGQWKSLSTAGKIQTRMSPEQVLPSLKEEASKWLGNPRVVESEGAWHLFWERGKYSRLGFYCIHLSVLVILAGALIGLYFGFRGYVNIAEGEVADRAALQKGNASRPLGFEVKLDKFTVAFYPSGAPREFKSVVTIMEGGKPVATEPIRVNHPLTYKGISLYQASYGLASVESVTLWIQDLTTGKEVTAAAKMGARTEIPGTQGTFAVARFVSDFQGGGPAFQIVVSEPSRPVETFWILQRHPEFSAGRPGRYQFRVKEMEPRYYSGLQVTKDPGVGVVWAGCFLLFAGFYLAFFMSHRRLWARVTPRQGGTLLELGGAAHRSRVEFQSRIAELKTRMQERFSRMENP
ncbi:MAG TPA: cytochrome c biogenesis protein ResB [Thermodesulfobacteriota bacterium]|nr:cytochrome c biogenesis protein ResB [Thermodesulfobacteriota bacterium]